jgi:hypothetical protein
VQKKLNAKIQEATFLKKPYIPAVTLAVKQNAITIMAGAFRRG